MGIGVADLSDELVSLVVQTNVVGSHCFSVFNVDDLEDRMSGAVAFPLAGVSYEGCRRHNTASDGTTPTFRPSSVGSAQMLTAYFLVIVVIDYRNASVVDTKPRALQLLDQLRSRIPSYAGVNSRPWRFNGETKLETRVEGVLMFGQMWETDIPRLSAQTN